MVGDGIDEDLPSSAAHSAVSDLSCQRSRDCSKSKHGVDHQEVWRQGGHEQKMA